MFSFKYTKPHHTLYEDIREELPFSLQSQIKYLPTL